MLVSLLKFQEKQARKASLKKLWWMIFINLVNFKKGEKRNQYLCSVKKGRADSDYHKVI